MATRAAGTGSSSKEIHWTANGVRSPIPVAAKESDSRSLAGGRAPGFASRLIFAERESRRGASLRTVPRDGPLRPAPRPGSVLRGGGGLRALLVGWRFGEAASPGSRGRKGGDGDRAPLPEKNGLDCSGVRGVARANCA